MELKYIVYITVNLCNGKIYIGVHKTNPDVFDGYIGCGVYRQSNAKENIAFHNAVKKYGYNNFRRTTIKIFPNTEEGKKQAYELEKELVNETFLKSKYVYNTALGGGTSFTDTKTVYMFDLKGEYLRSFKSCEKAAEYLKTDNVYNTLKAIRNNCLGTTQSSFGYYWSYSKKFNYQESKNITKVAQYTLSGKFLRTFDSEIQAELELQIPNIHQVIMKQGSSGGYQWRKFEGDTSDIKPLINIFKKNLIQPILMYDKKGNFIKRFDCVQDCLNEYKELQSTQISRVLRGIIKTHKGYSFKFEKDEDIVCSNQK